MVAGLIYMSTSNGVLLVSGTFSAIFCRSSFCSFASVNGFVSELLEFGDDDMTLESESEKSSHSAVSDCKDCNLSNNAEGGCQPDPSSISIVSIDCCSRSGSTSLEDVGDALEEGSSGKSNRREAMCRGSRSVWTRLSN